MTDKASRGQDSDDANDGEKTAVSRSDRASRRKSCSYDYRDPQTRRSKSRTSGEAVIRFKTGFRNTIYDVMKRRGWKETQSDLDWDFHWADREWMFECFDQVHLEQWQRVNHFRNDRELCRKDLLIKNVKRKKRSLEREKRMEEAARYDFCPTTFVLPGDYALFVEEFKKTPGQAWIMKPTGKAQGKGIFMFTKLKDINKWKSEHRWKPENVEVETYVVQRYIQNPYLVGGRKFDMRLYVLVTSYTPLTVYLYRGGFARFSATRYSTADLGNHFIHLTNVAIQKQGEDYNSDTGGKWDVRSLKLYMMERHGVERTDQVFDEIQGIVIRSLLSVQPIMINDKHCFELYGYDVIIDSDLRAWLLEVNASPSLSANTKHDYDLKCSMLNDMLDIIDMEKRRSPGDGDSGSGGSSGGGKSGSSSSSSSSSSSAAGSQIEEHRGGFDLIYHNGQCPGDGSCTYSSFLGCQVPSTSTTGRKGSSSSSSSMSKSKSSSSSGGGGGGGSGGGEGKGESKSGEGKTDSKKTGGGAAGGSAGSSSSSSSSSSGNSAPSSPGGSRRGSAAGGSRRGGSAGRARGGGASSSSSSSSGGGAAAGGSSSKGSSSSGAPRPQRGRSGRLAAAARGRSGGGRGRGKNGGASEEEEEEE